MRYDCVSGYCGALDCRTCYGIAADRYREEMVHDSHENPTLLTDECPECDRERNADEWAAEARYDQRREDV